MSPADEASLRRVRRLALKLGALLALTGAALATLLILALVRFGAFHGTSGGLMSLVVAAAAGTILIVAAVAALNLRDRPQDADPAEDHAPAAITLQPRRGRRPWIILVAGLLALAVVLAVRLA